MNYLPFLLLSLIINFSIYAKDFRCSELKVSLLGSYGPSGKIISPILKKWSLKSGELSQVQIQSHLKFSTIVLSLKSEDGKTNKMKVLKIKNNTTEKFKLSSLLAEALVTNKFLHLQVVDSFSNEYCYEESEILEVDGSDGIRGSVNEKTN